jgi:Kef-type K+ transport system membrane component KefB
MPLLFILFFVLAGASLHIALLPSLGLVGLIYIVSRAAGLMGGAWIGSVLGRAEANIRKYLGLGILSQAGVAIGLSLIVKQEFTPLGAWGASIGTAVITTVTATSIVFEIVGPILTKIGLQKAGEIPDKADT